MTLRELIREFVAGLRRRHVEHNDRAWVVWHTAAFIRGTKGLPKLEKLMIGQTRASRKQSSAEMAAMWQVIAARFGGKFVPMKARASRGC